MVRNEGVVHMVVTFVNLKSNTMKKITVQM